MVKRAVTSRQLAALREGRSRAEVDLPVPIECDIPFRSALGGIAVEAGGYEIDFLVHGKKP
ncbi:hypothetical protein ACSMXN_15615 [Jatrophihabitans sp. DSM 45814]